MSISAIFGSRISTVPISFTTNKVVPWSSSNSGCTSVIECSSRPTKKATAHHMKTRPKKTQSWDIRRKPTVYAPLPPLPPEWTVVSSAESSVDGGFGGAVSAEVDASSPSLPSSSQAPPKA